MITILRADALHKDFIALVQLLDKELALRDGDDHQFYAQYNKTANLKHTIVAYHNNVPVAIGALKNYDAQTVEIKRMYCIEEVRGKGYATAVLNELEIWARELGHQLCILETGRKQPEAIALYKKCNYQIIPNYGQYANVYNSVCFQKTLI